jgi:glycerol-3-phosphate acyltransferase PlsX
MRVILDAMGGDHAPTVTVEGAIAAAREGHEVTLVGREDTIRQELEKHRTPPTLNVVHAADVVEMHEHPATAVRQKRESSINVGMRLAKESGAAFVSAGNSGAILASALFTLGRIEGVHRPAIGALIPLLHGRVFLTDAGANADCDARNLLQFAQLGSAYMRQAYAIATPRVGLVSIGEEESKGNALVLETHALLKDSGLHFVGNVEPKDVTRGACDVAVADGFTGNVMLKLAEGMQELILGLIREAIVSKPHYKLAGAVLRPGLRAAGRRLDYTEYGGAPLVGGNAPVFSAPGRSPAKAITSAIRTASQTPADLIPALTAAISV